MQRERQEARRACPSSCCAARVGFSPRSRSVARAPRDRPAAAAPHCRSRGRQPEPREQRRDDLGVARARALCEASASATSASLKPKRSRGAGLEQRQGLQALDRAAREDRHAPRCRRPSSDRARESHSDPRAAVLGLDGVAAPDAHEHRVLGIARIDRRPALRARCSRAPPVWRGRCVVVAVSSMTRRILPLPELPPFPWAARGAIRAIRPRDETRPGRPDRRRADDRRELSLAS